MVQCTILQCLNVRTDRVGNNLEISHDETSSPGFFITDATISLTGGKDMTALAAEVDALLEFNTASFNPEHGGIASNMMEDVQNTAPAAVGAAVNVQTG